MESALDRNFYTNKEFQSYLQIVFRNPPENGSYVIRNATCKEAKFIVPHLISRLVIFENCKFEQLIISSDTKVDVTIGQGNSIDSLEVLSSKMNLNLIGSINKISLQGVVGNYTFSDVQCKDLSLLDCSGNISIEGGNYGRTLFKIRHRKDIKNVLWITMVIIDNLLIQDSHLEVLWLQLLEVTNRFTVEDVRLGNMTLVSADVGLKAQFIRIEALTSESSSVKLLQSHLKQVSFSYCDLETNKTIELTESTFLDCTSTNSKWSEEIQGENKVKQKGFMELHKMFVNSNEFDQSERFKSLSMKYYYLSEKERRKSFKEWIDYLFKLKLPYATSEFGYRFYKPLGWLFGVHMALAMLLITLQGKELGVWFSLTPDWGGVREGIELWAYTVLPTHRLSYNDGVISPAISLLMRLTSGVLIYQMVLASRKHIGGK